MDFSTSEVQKLLQAARLNLAQGQFHEAVAQATEVIRQDSKQTAAYLLRAEAHRRLKKLERALADLAVAIRLDPQQPGPYVIRAEILKRRNIFDQAIADATYALTLDPRNAAAFSIRAECRSAIGDLDGANEDVQEMLLIDPTRPVPTLGITIGSGDAAPKMASDSERFWKEAARNLTEDERTLFADGKPVDKSYRSRPVVSDEDAPEILGAASGYKPEVISRPIPTTRAGSKGSLSRVGIFLVTGIGLIAGFALWMVFREATNLSPAHPPRPQVDRAAAETPTSVSAPFPAAEPRKPVEKVVAKIGPTVARVSLSVPAIDLKALLDPRRDSVGSMWDSVEGGIISPEGGSVIKIPYDPPPEYRLTLKLLKGSKRMVGIGLVTKPSSVLITLDSYPDQGCFSNFDVVDGRGIVFHSGTRVLPLFELSTVACTVRKNSVRVESNGRQIGQWEGDFRRLSVHHEWQYGGTGLFIASVGKGTVIRGIKLEPIADDGDAIAATSSEAQKIPKPDEHVVGKPPQRSESQTSVRRLIDVAIDRDGSGELVAGTRPADQIARGKSEDSGTPVSGIDGLKNAVITRLKDGRFRIIHDFQKFQDIEDLRSPFNSIDPAQHEIDHQNGVLELKPVPERDFRRAQLRYPRQLRLPLNIRLVFDAYIDDGFIGLPFYWPKSIFNINVHGVSLDKNSPKDAEVGWLLDQSKPNEWNSIELRRLEGTALKSLFQVPLGGPLADERISPAIGIRTGNRSNSTLKIRQIEVIAHVVGKLGVTLDERKGKVVAAQILEGAGARAGIKPGDEFVSVDGQSVKGMAALMSRLAKLNVGDAMTLNVLRGGKPVEFHAVAD